MALAAAGCGSEKDPVQSADDLVAALAAAEPGDTVEIGEGNFEGAFEVGSGVDVRGSGRGDTVLIGLDGEAALTVLPGEGSTQVSNLTIRSGVEGGDSEIGIYMKDAGRVTIDRVEVEVAFGIAIGAEALDGLTLNDVTAIGAVTDGNASNWPSLIDSQNAPAHGVVVIRTGAVTIDALTVSGFAATGVQLVESSTLWINGSVHTNMGASVLIAAGTASLEAVNVSGMLQGFQLVAPYGLAVTAGAEVDTTNLSIFGGVEGESIGMLQDASTSAHRNLSVTENRGIGIQVQHSVPLDGVPAFELEAGDNDLSRNRGVGLAVIESDGIVVRDTVIDDTELVTRIVGDLGAVEVGDGLEIRRCGDTDCDRQLTDVRIESVSLHGNGRAGMIIEALDAPASGVFCGSVDVDADGIGAVVQNNTDPPVGWGGIVNTGSDDVLETVRGLIPDFNEGGTSLDDIAGR